MLHPEGFARQRERTGGDRLLRGTSSPATGWPGIARENAMTPIKIVATTAAALLLSTTGAAFAQQGTTLAGPAQGSKANGSASTRPSGATGATTGAAASGAATGAGGAATGVEAGRTTSTGGNPGGPVGRN